MRKKRFISLLVIILLIISSYVFIQFNIANNMKGSCFDVEFEKTFKKNDSIELNKIYDFTKIFNCKDWDKIIIVGGTRANRAVVFLKEGVALPKINYSNRLSESLIFYFVKDGKLTSSPISYWQSNFMYFKDFNDFDYICLDKENSIFKCVELETLGNKETILTFELIKR